MSARRAGGLTHDGIVRIGEEQYACKVTSMSATDYLSAAQLGFLLLARGDTAAAMPLLDLILKGGDEDLANRVRAVLRLPPTRPYKTKLGVSADDRGEARPMKRLKSALTVAFPHQPPGDDRLVEALKHRRWNFQELEQISHEPACRVR